MSAHERAMEAVRERDHIRKSVGFQASFEELTAVYNAALRREGWRMVPLEATEEMIDAHYQAHAECEQVFADPADVWKAMLAAAPSPHDKEGEQ